MHQGTESPPPANNFHTPDHEHESDQCHATIGGAEKPSLRLRWPCWRAEADFHPVNSSAQRFLPLSRPYGHTNEPAGSAATV